MGEIKLIRRRYIPDERIELNDDRIIFCDDEKIVTKWDVLTKRHDFTHGVSCYYINEGIKVSKFLDDDNKLVYWYCDIIDTVYDKISNTYTFNDLLADVIIYQDGRYEVADLDEIALALEQNLLPKAIIAGAMKKLNRLLKAVFDGSFKDYQDFLNGFEK